MLLKAAGASASGPGHIDVGRRPTLLKILVGLLLVILALKGCADVATSPRWAYHQERWEALQKVKAGMAQAEVEEIMGTPERTTVTYPVAEDAILPESIEARREAVSEYAVYLNGYGNLYIIAFDADGLVIGKAYMWEGPFWEQKEGTIKSRPKKPGTEQ